MPWTGASRDSFGIPFRNANTEPNPDSFARNIHSVLSNGECKVVRWIGASFQGNDGRRRFGPDRTQNGGRIYARPRDKDSRAKSSAISGGRCSRRSPSRFHASRNQGRFSEGESIKFVLWA